MLIFPAIDLLNGAAVRLYKGDYQQKTVYSTDPVSVALDFKKCGAEAIHIVDLDGAKNGTTPNFELVCKIKQATGLFCEIGGGVRSMETIEKYLQCGIDRVILGTAAVENESFVTQAAEQYRERIAVGIDIKDGKVALKGWCETSEKDAFSLCEQIQRSGIKTVICTDISKDGAMSGTNRELYKILCERFNMNITASGGVSSLDDVASLREMGIYGAIIGKAYYTGAIDLSEAIRVAR